jgi:ketosteroid isomerase-like protein
MQASREDRRWTLTDLDEVIERYHQALDEFARGDPAPVKALYAHADDITLANPFVGPPAHGWAEISAALDYASSNFRDGEMTSSERIEAYVTTDLATILELERWQAKVGEREEVVPFLLRVTTTFRRDRDSWTMVHRHADPIATPSPEGPLRTH